MTKFKSLFILARIATLVGAAFLLPGIGRAALTWQTQRIELTSKPSDKTAVGVFPFENRGQTTVTIISVQSSCGCTTAELEKHTYAPGESGEIKAVFTLGDRVGDQEKTIYVTTDDAAARPVSLVLQVMIPEYLTYSPRLLLWSIGEDLVDKATSLSAKNKQQITNLTLLSPVPPEITARIEPIEAGASYKLLVRPVSTANVINVPVAGVATFADGTTQPFKIYVLIR